MPDIPIRVTGSGLETFDRIQNGFKKVQGAAAGAAAASRMPIRAPAGGLMPADFFPGVRMGNFGSGFTPSGWSRAGRDSLGRSEHGGRHHGIFGAIHGAARVAGGAFGEVGERLGGVGHLAAFGTLGIAVAGLGVAFNALSKNAERAAEQMGKAWEMAGKYISARQAGQTSQMDMGLQAAREGNGLRQLANQGLIDGFKAARAKGYDGSAESFASLGGNKNRLTAVLTAHALGAGTDQAAEMAKLLGANANGTLAGRQIASQILRRPISESEFGRMQANQKRGITAQINAVERFQGQTANAKLGYLENGMAAAGAGRDLGAARDPTGKAFAELQKATQDEVEKLHAMAEAHGKFFEAVSNAARQLGVGPGSYSQQANDVLDAGSAGESMAQP